MPKKSIAQNAINRPLFSALNLKLLFPKTEKISKKNLTPYQTKKIKRAIAGLEAHGYTDTNYTPLKKGLKKFQRAHDVPAWVRGVALPPGASAAVYERGALSYIRGENAVTRVEITPPIHEADLIAQLRAALAHPARMGRNAKLLVNGGAVGSFAGGTPDNNAGNNFFIAMVLKFYEKYAEAHTSGQIVVKVDRLTGQKQFAVSANPADWALAVAFFS